LRVMTISSGSFRAFAPVRTDPDPVYNKFLDLFSERVGADPLFVTLLLAAVFYGFAALRGVRWAASGLTLSIAAVSIVAINSIREGWMSSPHPGPLAIASLLPLYLGWRKRSAARLMVAALCLSGAIALVVPTPNVGLAPSDVRFAIFGHLVVTSMLGLGAF